MPSLQSISHRVSRPRRIAVASAAALTLLACRLMASVPVPPTPTPTPTPVPPTPTAFPTETAAPSPTPLAPTATELPDILFTESFDDETTCFRLHTFEPGVELAIREGAYHVRVEGDTAVDLPCMGGYDDFAMAFDLAFTEAGEQSLVGFTFRSYVGTSYNIYLNGDAQFCWDHADFNAEEFRVLAGCWFQLPTFVTSGETIRLGVIAAGDRMAVLINGFLLTTATDSTNDYGSFGYFVLNNGPGATEIVLDNILIRELVEDDLEYFREDQTGF